ncbi:CoA transferase [Cryptosporangium phraense]|uniref:CoA transferase n=1 Tax=Cryptosporangium phraense TaxID=2593070 RepID=UPI00197A82C6|nr:CoA transferase [Cryptosporangium phraense]
MSGFFRTRDGWVRTHANYPHHAERLLAVLGLRPGADRAAVAGRLATRSSLSFEADATTAGALAVAMRTPDEWAASDAGRAVAGEPLVRVTDSGEARRPLRVLPEPGAGPAAGLRVLDLTRVIAGPVATRTLAYLGADVLRVDPPGLPELVPQHLDTGLGKRSTLLDLTDRADRARFDTLLADADVLVTGYRSDAMHALGLDAGTVRATHPDLVVASLTAWGDSGPWRGRRGFDSLVQVATGVAVVTGSADDPGVLPAQALDHATGYLLAAAILEALTRRASGGGGSAIAASLARTASWLLSRPRPASGGRTPDPGPWLADLPSPYGTIRHAVPPFRLDAQPHDWVSGPVGWGTSPPRWL